MNISHFLMCIFVRQLYWNVSSQSKLYGIIKNWFINVYLLQKFQFRLYLDKISEGAGTHVKRIFSLRNWTFSTFMLVWKIFTETTEPWNCVLNISQSIRYFAIWLKGQTHTLCLCSSISAICEAFNTSLSISPCLTLPRSF